MAAILLRPAVLRPATLSLTIGLGTASGLAAHHLLSRQRPAYSLRCDSAAGFSSGATSQYGSSNNAKNPIFKNGRVNPQIFRQISTGSIAGLVGGLVVSAFSKPLAILLGLLVVGAQAVESRFGVQLIPYRRVQRLFSKADVRGSLRDNVALKISFGVTFALAAFAEF